MKRSIILLGVLILCFFVFAPLTAPAGDVVGDVSTGYNYDWGSYIGLNLAYLISNISIYGGAEYWMYYAKPFFSPFYSNYSLGTYIKVGHILLQVEHHCEHQFKHQNPPHAMYTRTYTYIGIKIPFSGGKLKY